MSVLLLALACGTGETRELVPTVTSIPTSTVAPTPTFQPAPATPTVQPSPSTPTPPAEPVITVGEASFRVELADTPEKRSLGLSGRTGLDAGTGMLFVFDSERQLVFWMREMQFPLDFVWISADCSVADITEDVPQPPPGTDQSGLLRYRPAVPAQYVLEINSGEVAAAGIARGDPVGFAGSIAGRYGC